MALKTVRVHNSSTTRLRTAHLTQRRTTTGLNDVPAGENIDDGLECIRNDDVDDIELLEIAFFGISFVLLRFYTLLHYQEANDAGRRPGKRRRREQVRPRERTGFDAARNVQEGYQLFFTSTYRLWDSYPDEWREYGRMDRQNFDALYALLQPFLHTPRLRARPDSIQPTERLLLALMWLGGGGEFTMARKATGRHATTISQSVDEVCEAICLALQDEIRLPTVDELRTTADWFRDHTGMLGCIGGYCCIDFHSHCWIARWRSNIAWGSASDGGIWQTSAFASLLARASFPPDESAVEYGGHWIPLYLAG